MKKLLRKKFPLSYFSEAHLPLGSRASKWTSFLLLVLLVGGGLVYWKTAQGVNRTWDGGGVDGGELERGRCYPI